MNPAQALRRIAYLLEAEGAETYKVQAFRRAAATVDDVPPDELARLDDQGRLETLAGVGKSTAAVISQALSGSVPEYLHALELRATEPPGGPVGKLLRSLRGDCHSHSNWSDGGSPIDEMARSALELGHEYLVLTDHSPRLTVANGLERRGPPAPDRSGRQSERGAGPLPPHYRHRSRHPRRWLARPGRRAARLRSGSWWRACTRNCGWKRPT